MTKSQIKKAKEREKMRAKEQLKYEKISRRRQKNSKFAREDKKL